MNNRPEEYDDDYLFDDFNQVEEEWTDDDEAALEEWEEWNRQRIAERNEY